jgi:hypothetical protein
VLSGWRSLFNIQYSIFDIQFFICPSANPVSQHSSRFAEGAPSSSRMNVAKAGKGRSTRKQLAEANCNKGVFSRDLLQSALADCFG